MFAQDYFNYNIYFTITHQCQYTVL